MSKMPFTNDTKTKKQNNLNMQKWYFVTKIVPVIKKKKLEFDAEGQEFANFLRSPEQFIQTVKG